MAAPTNARFAAALRAAQQDTARRLGDAKAERESDADRRAEAGRLLAELFTRVPSPHSGSPLTAEQAQAVLDAETAAQRREQAADQQ